jgi:hypothetical protein
LPPFPFLQLASLKHQTCVDHLTHLSQLLLLDTSQTTRLVLRLPQLLVYAPARLDSAFGRLAELAGGTEQARGLVLQSPQVWACACAEHVACGSLHRLWSSSLTRCCSPVVACMWQ